MTCWSSASFESSHGYQTDGINITGSDAAHMTIQGNVITTCGEGIDLFGNYSCLLGNSIRDAKNTGIKLIHGAAGNTILGNSIYQPGRSGIEIGGSGVVPTDSQYNVVVGNSIVDVDPNNLHGGSGAGLRLQAGGGEISSTIYNLLANNLVYPGANGTLWAVENTLENPLRDNYAARFTGTSHVPGSPRSMADAIRCNLKVGRTADQTIATDTFTKVQFNSIILKTTEEWDSLTDFRYEAARTRILDVFATVQIDGATAGDKWRMTILKNGGSTQAFHVDYVKENGEFHMWVRGKLEIEVSEFFDIQLEHNNGGNQTVKADNERTYVEVTEVG